MYKVLPADESSAHQVESLLNKVTLNLHEHGVNQWIYPWNFSNIEKDIKDNKTYVLLSGDKIIGTFSLKSIDYSWFDFIKKDSMYLYKIAVLPEYQGKGAGLFITDYACKSARYIKKTLYLDCWAGNEKLKSFYTKAGFCCLGDFPEEDYKISIFIF